MKVTEKKLEDGRILLEAVANPVDIDKALFQAQIQFAVKMGLKPEQGKTPAQVAEEQLGIRDLDAIVEQQAIEMLVPFAIDKKNLLPAYPPKPMATTRLRRGHEFPFRMYILPKPAYELKSYEPVEFTVAPFKFDETQLNEQLNQMRTIYTEYLDEIGEPHPVGPNDACFISLEAVCDGEPLSGLCTTGRTYETGSGLMPEEFDAAIVGMKPGETKKFEFNGPSVDDEGHEISKKIQATVTVLKNQKSFEPEINDEFVKKYMPMFRSYDDMVSRMRADIENEQRFQYDDYVRQHAAAELAKRFEGSIDDAIYEAMMENVKKSIQNDLAQSGIDFDEYVESNGGMEQFRMMSMLNTRSALQQGYALDAVFRHEKLSVKDEDLDDVCRMMAPGDVKGIRRNLEESGQGYTLRESAERLRANKWVVENAIIHYEEEK